MKFDSLDSNFAYARFHQVPSNRILTKLTLRFRSCSLSVHCEFSRIVCVSLFSYQGCLSCDSFAILTCCLLFVKNFFNKFFKLLQHLFFSTAFRVYHNSFALSRTFFFLSSRKNGEGGIWTLAPLLTTYSLSRGAPSASLGTSPNCPRFVVSQKRLSSHSRVFIYFSSFSPKNLVHYIALCICLSSTFFKTF